MCNKWNLEVGVDWEIFDLYQRQSPFVIFQTSADIQLSASPLLTGGD